MKLFRDIKNAIKRYRLLNNPNKWADYIHEKMVGYFILRKYKYLENKNTHYIKSNFVYSDTITFNMDYYIDGSCYVYRCVIMNNIPEERMRDAMIMATHLNNKLRYCNVYVEPDYRVIYSMLKLDLPLCVHSPWLMYDLIESHYDDCAFIAEAYEKLFASDEDPIFIIAEMIERIKQKQKDSENKTS